jgi:hypothetical protein
MLLFCDSKEGYHPTQMPKARQEIAPINIPKRNVRRGAEKNLASIAAGLLFEGASLP